jgi:flagellar protein FlaJ
MSRKVTKSETVVFICPDCGERVTHLHEHQYSVHGISLREVQSEKVKKTPSYGGHAYVRFSGISEWAVAHFGLRRRIKAADMSVPPEGYAGTAITRTLIAVLIAAPLGIALTVLFAVPYFLAVLAAPLLVFLSYMYYPSVKASSRGEKIELELAFLSAYLAMAVSAGVPFYAALKRIGTEPNPLVSSSKEIMTIETDAEYFLKDEELSAEKLSVQHPSRAFRAWLAGVLHVNRMGGDLVAHLDNTVDQTLSQLEDMWNEYVEHASTIGTLTALLYALLPITIYVFLLVMITSTTLVFAIVYAFFISPLGAVMLMMLSEGGRPKPPTNYTQYYRLMAVGTIPAAIFAGIALLQGVTIPFIVGISSIIVFLPAAVKFELDWKSETSIESNLPRLIDDISENRRIGQDIDAAFGHVAGRHRYGKALDEIVDMLAFNIGQFTISISQVLGRVRLRSWHSNAIFFLLREATETGGGQVSVFDRLARFADRYVGLNMKIKRSLRGYQALFYAISVAIISSMLFIANFIISPQTGLLGTLSITGGPTNIIATQANLQLMQTIAITGAVLNSALLGMIAGKVGRGTIAGGSIHVIIGVTVALITVVVLGLTMGGLSTLIPSAFTGV